MRLMDIMNSKVQTIGKNETIERARAIMSERGMHHLVVTEGKAVIGVLSERDCTNRAYSQQTLVSECMATDVAIAEADTSVKDAANEMRGRGVGCLPIMDGDRLVGIVTVSDLLEAMGRGGAVSAGQAGVHSETARRRGPASTVHR